MDSRAGRGHSMIVFNLWRIGRRWSVAFLALALISMVTVLPVAAVSGQGSVQLTIKGYGSVHGQLLDAAVQPEGNITMLMVVNDQMQTSYGSFPIVANGMWNGIRNGSSVYGEISNVTGNVQICIMSLCSKAYFVGDGEWAGSLTDTLANGTFTGTITFANSPPPIPQGQPMPVSGTWNADLSTPSTNAPEFNSSIVVYLTVFGLAMTLSLIRRKNRL